MFPSGTRNGQYALDDKLEHLTAPEQALFEDIKHGRIGARVRLEQERVSHGLVQPAIQAAFNLTSKNNFS